MEPNNLNNQFLDGVDNTKKLLNCLIKNKKINQEYFSKISNNINEILNFNTVNIFTAIHNIQSETDIIYIHCFNVAVISMLISNWCGYDSLTKEKILEGAITHDIGKLLIDEEILNKESALSNTERAQVSSHTVEGYKMLRDSGLSRDTLSSILMHHERIDGSGYPLGLRGEKINFYARLIAIADVYEGMTAKRLYRVPFSPGYVINFIKENRDKFDKNIVNVFVEKMNPIKEVQF